MNAGDFHTQHVFGLWVAPDFNDPSRYSPYLMQGGIDLPDRDYYLSDKPEMAAIRAKYQAHLVAMLKLAGIADAEGRASRTIALERKIAQVHVSQEDSEDVHKANNPWAMDEFARRAPGLDWAAFFGAAGLKGQGRIIVWQPTAITGIRRARGAASRSTPGRSCSSPPCARARAAVPPGGVRRRGLRLLRQGALGDARESRAMEAGRERDQRRARRRGGPRST